MRHESAHTIFCKGCWDQMHMPIPIGGPLSVPFRMFGITRSKMNPNICTICERAFKTVKRKGHFTHDATILFSDIRGYTRLSEMIDPIELSGIVSEFQDQCAQAIWSVDGIVNKQMGDGVMAIFNFPIHSDDHAQRAVNAARAIQSRCSVSLGKLAGSCGLADNGIGVGIGIHSGPVEIGEFSRRRSEFTAIGGVVNLASRLEGQAKAGGVSARSSGQLYLGGGTRLQQACGFPDSPDEMAAYMKLACGPGADVEKIELFAGESASHYDWLVGLGVPFKASFVPTTEATNPPDEDGLTYTGSEPAWPFREAARPAPRGHNVRHVGDSGFVLMRVLLEAVRREGVEVRTQTRVERLAIGEGGRVVGVGVGSADHDELWIGASRGVVLATGGFGFNREMLARHAPKLLDCHAVGLESEDGLGIRLGMAAGGEALRMDAASVMVPFSKPRSLVRGILVNGRGERFINEDVYQAVHGDVFLNRQDGIVYLILDDATFSEPQLPFPLAGVGETPEVLEAALALPPRSLVETLQRWNEGALCGEDPLFHKGKEWVTPLQAPPFRALDLGLRAFPYPFFTLGGLRTDPSGRVRTPEGEVIEGLFAAGRATSGMPVQGYNSGMSLADCTFFGRRAGRSAAGVEG